MTLSFSGWNSALLVSKTVIWISDQFLTWTELTGMLKRAMQRICTIYGFTTVGILCCSLFSTQFSFTVQLSTSKSGQHVLQMWWQNFLFCAHSEFRFKGSGQRLTGSSLKKSTKIKWTKGALRGSRSSRLTFWLLVYRKQNYDNDS